MTSSHCCGNFKLVVTLVAEFICVVIKFLASKGHLGVVVHLLEEVFVLANMEDADPTPIGVEIEAVGHRVHHNHHLVRFPNPP